MFFKFDRYTQSSFGQYRIQTAAANNTFGTNYRLNRYNTPTDNLAADSILEEWLPKSAQMLNRLFRNIHKFDSIAGPAVDLISIMPFSDVTLIGVEDPKILEVYEQSLAELHIETLLPEIACEYLVIGRVVGSLLFDKSKGIWTDVILQDPDFCDITNIPLRGYDPKIDLKLSEDFKKFLLSRDPRDLAAKQDMPDDFLKLLLSADRLPLDPASTLYLPRKTFPNDYLGSSIYYRILPFYALEKTLINGTLVGAKRRQRSILHVMIGEPDVWEPDEDEISSIAGMFMRADEDPQGAIVATRNGVATNEVRSGADFWKLSDEWDFLSTAKMRALGINEAFLSGDATYNTMEVALSVFVETLRSFRDSLVSRIFYEKLFPILAEIHGFKRRTQAELDHHIRIEGRSVNSSLIIPQFNFHKQLRPEADTAYLEVLGTMEEKGIPVPLRTWAAAGGLNLEKLLDMEDEDIENRKSVQGWKDKVSKETGGVEPGAGGEGGAVPPKEGGTWGSLVNARVDVIRKALDSLPIWINNRFCGVSKDKFVSILKAQSPSKKLVTLYKHSPKQLRVANYVLHRMGANQLPFNVSAVRDVAEFLKRCGGIYSPRRVSGEFTFLNKLVRSGQKGRVAGGDKQMEKLLPPPMGNQLYSGVVE